MKTFTDLEQSKKLVEILPLETADMKWYFWKSEIDTPKLPTFGYSKDAAEGWESTEVVYLPCWSLATLLTFLPFHVDAYNRRFEFSMLKGRNKNSETYEIKYTLFLEKRPFLHLTDSYNNPVDACVEMILKLHELNLLK